DVDVLFEGRFHRPFDLDAPLRFLANPCESAPVPARAAAEPAMQPAESALATRPDAARAAAPPLPIELLRGLVAARAELPASGVRDDSRLLSDLHLNSITVGQLVVEASRQLGLGPPASPTDYALATVAEVAAALAERARADVAGGGAGTSGEGIGGDSAAPGGVAGIDSWVRPFTVDLGGGPPGPNP